MSVDYSQPVSTAISITVTRADGTVEDLGVVSYSSKNLLHQKFYDLTKKLGFHVSREDIAAYSREG